MRHLLPLGASILFALGCSTAEARRPPAVPMSPRLSAVPAQHRTTAPAPLPPGWSWPLDVRAGLAAASSIMRPFDVSRLIPAAGKGPCAPVQIGPSFWISLPCGGIPQLSRSNAVPRIKSLLPTSNLPASVDLRERGLDGPVLDQQMVGVCWTFALSDVMDNALRRRGRNDVIAPMHVLASDTFNQLWQHGASTEDLVTEPQWPYDPAKACKLNEDKSERWCGPAYHVKPGSWRSDPALASEVDRADSSGYFHVASVEKLDTPVDPDQIAALIASGHAVYDGMEINTKAWGYAATRAGVIPDYVPQGPGHAVVLMGYRGTGASRQFLVHNSWGKAWAKGGYAWISSRMVREHSLDALTLEVGETNARPLPPNPRQASPGRSTSNTRPAPAPAPSSSSSQLPWPFASGASCAAGQTRDAVFGVCVAPCPGGSAPVAGLCAPGTSASQSCAAGRVRDWVTHQCVVACPNGLPPAGGFCAPW